MVKNPPASAGGTRDVGLIPGSGRSPGEGNGNPLQCVCLENSMDRGAWQAVVHAVAGSWIRLIECTDTHCGKLLHNTGSCDELDGRMGVGWEGGFKGGLCMYTY